MQPDELWLDGKIAFKIGSQMTVKQSNALPFGYARNGITADDWLDFIAATA